MPGLVQQMPFGPVAPVLAIALAPLALASTPLPVRAEVLASGDSGFVVSHRVVMPSDDVAEAWEALIHPERWWDAAHTWSQDPANLSLVPQAGACFCEQWGGAQPGSVEHMRVIHVREQARLVMRGSLGPMQQEALVGTLTVTLEPGAQSGSSIMSWTYVVGGYARYSQATIAPAVDAVLGEQLRRLQAHAEAIG